MTIHILYEQWEGGDPQPLRWFRGAREAEKARSRKPKAGRVHYFIKPLEGGK